MLREVTRPPAPFVPLFVDPQKASSVGCEPPQPIFNDLRSPASAGLCHINDMSTKSVKHRNSSVFICSPHLSGGFQRRRSTTRLVILGMAGLRSSAFHLLTRPVFYSDKHEGNIRRITQTRSIIHHNPKVGTIPGYSRRKIRIK